MPNDAAGAVPPNDKVTSVGVELGPPVSVARTSSWEPGFSVKLEPDGKLSATVSVGLANELMSVTVAVGFGPSCPRLGVPSVTKKSSPLVATVPER